MTDLKVFKPGNVYSYSYFDMGDVYKKVPYAGMRNWFSCIFRAATGYV